MDSVISTNPYLPLCLISSAAASKAKKDALFDTYVLSRDAQFSKLTLDEMNATTQRFGLASWS